MPAFTIDRHIDAPVERVWEVLDDFGAISRWNPGVKVSTLTSSGAVQEGSTRTCELTPFGSVHERIERYVPNERMTVNIHEASKLPISSGVADFSLAPEGGGTDLTLHYSYELNRLGRMAKGVTDKQLRKGIGALADSLAQESERAAGV